MHIFLILLGALFGYAIASVREDEANRMREWRNLKYGPSTQEKLKP